MHLGPKREDNPEQPKDKAGESSSSKKGPAEVAPHFVLPHVDPPTVQPHLVDPQDIRVPLLPFGDAVMGELESKDLGNELTLENPLVPETQAYAMKVDNGLLTAEEEEQLA